MPRRRTPSVSRRGHGRVSHAGATHLAIAVKPDRKAQPRCLGHLAQRSYHRSLSMSRPYAVSLTWNSLRVLSPASALDSTELMMLTPLLPPVIQRSPRIARPLQSSRGNRHAAPRAYLPRTHHTHHTHQTRTSSTPPKLSRNRCPAGGAPFEARSSAKTHTGQKILLRKWRMSPCLGPRDPPARGDTETSSLALIALPKTSQEAAAGNVPASPVQKMEDRPPAPVEGREAGPGKLFDRGDVRVVPGAGAGGGSGA